ncbi:dynein axonemal assembly factor 8 isoform X1 [Brachyistius frenatus]|uniref:dynein axonemal assembly factor 8 isoform X1 n=1 Tax=Brachyistius frenatus TaxID=100188 RepID=UPI0037E7F2AF
MDAMSPQQYVPDAPVETHADGDRKRSQENTMKRLLALCKNQSLSEPVKSPNCIRQNNMRNISLEKSASELQLSHQECPTVYIDLRSPDPSIKPARTSPNLSSEPESPAKHNTHRASPPAEKHNLKVHTGSQKGSRKGTGKSMLLQKLREKNLNGNKYWEKCTNLLEAEEMEDRPTQPVESTGDYHSQHLCGDQQSIVKSRKPEMEPTPTVEQSSIKEPKQQSDLQRRHVKQTSEILKQLKKHHPNKSVTLKRPAAERTDVLDESEASHPESISTLPAADNESKSCMLLTVNLSSPGVVSDRADRKRKHLHPAAAKSHIYNALVAWFLSLADPDPSHDEDEVPFWVAGLQQRWTEGELALHVLAVAHHCYTPRKRDSDIRAPFYNHVCRFLSETSLTVIANWLPQLTKLLEQQPHASPIHLPSCCLNCFISATSNKKVIDWSFDLGPGFCWQTVETQEHVSKGRETSQELHTEVSVVLGSSGFFQHPLITHYTLQLVLDSGLDVCGLRLLYPPQGLLSNSVGSVPGNKRTDETCRPVLALAVRGPHAHSLLKDLTSSLGPLLAEKAEKTSVNPRHCGSQEPLIVHSPQLASEVQRELCLWFSGRLGGGSPQNHNQRLNSVVPSDDRIKGSLSNSSRTSSFLCATTKADLLLVVSPVVPPCCYGQVLAACERRGFGLIGLQRLQLPSNRAAVLGLTNLQTTVFCGPPAAVPDREELKLPSRCLVLLLRKENALRHSVSLPSALMREFKAQKLLSCIHSRRHGVHTVEPRLCFHTVLYNSNLYSFFVRCMWAVPDPSGVILSRASTSDMEQVVILTLCGKSMSQGLSLLHCVLTEGPEGDAGFELLGLKWLPVLTRFQAQELSLYEVGEQLCSGSVDALMSSPALVCALRGFDAFASLRKLLPQNPPQHVLTSPTPEVALRQVSLFFFEHELIPGKLVVACIQLLVLEDSLKQFAFCSDPQMLLTVCLFEPRVWDHALARILSKLQQSGFTLVSLRVMSLDKSDATSRPPAESVQNKCSSLALCLQGENAVRSLLHLLGQEDSSPWTTCYGSGSYQQAIEDVKRFFPEGLCCTETSTMRREQILSLCSDPSASVEREQSCTLTHAAQGSLSVSVASGPNGGSQIHRARWQTTCLLIALNAPPHSQAAARLEVVEQLLRSGCHLVAGRMSILDNEQQDHIAETLAVSQSGREKMARFYTAPCLVMALQGEKIVAGLSLILKSIYKERPDLQNMENMIFYPESDEEAKKLTCYLFDALSPESCDTIVP